jgi:hypothetical protein
MRDRISRIWKRHPILTALFALAFVAMVGFGIRTVSFWLYWQNPDHHEQPIEAWMPPRYVGMSFGIPPEILGPLLGLATGDDRHITMGQIASERGQSLEDLASEIKAAADAARAAGDR